MIIRSKGIIPGNDPPKYGFQKSENTRAVVTIYQQHNDPIMFYAKKKGDAFTLKGNRGDNDTPSVISVMVNKNINSASGTFTVVLKPSKVSTYIERTITDDDWIDITFWINNNPFHIFRGIIDEINRNKTIGGTGATIVTYTITGRCFGKVFEVTPIWFSPFYNEIVTEAISLNVLDVPAVGGSPDKVAITFLKGYLEQSEGVNGPNWRPPSSMPGISGTNFIRNVNFNDNPDGTSKYFQDKPQRDEFNQKFIMPQGYLWDLAKEFSDPLFTEIYTDYILDGNPFNRYFHNPVSDGGGQMTVVVRDKPFPFLTTSVPIGYRDTWSDLPVFNVNTQEIRDHNVSKGGYERYNSFFVAPRILQEDVNENVFEKIIPLIDKESIKIHGLRRMDFTSECAPRYDDKIDELCKYQRQLLRDWYCMNPYMLSGTIILGHGRPDIHMGCRLNIPGIILNNKEIIPEENYYIEGVSHNWIFGQGVRTQLEVTRGWLGDDASYMETLARIASKYELANITAEVPSVG